MQANPCQKHFKREAWQVINTKVDTTNMHILSLSVSLQSNYIEYTKAQTDNYFPKMHIRWEYLVLKLGKRKILRDQLVVTVEQKHNSPHFAISWLYQQHFYEEVLHMRPCPSADS